MARNIRIPLCHSRTAPSWHRFLPSTHTARLRAPLTALCAHRAPAEKKHATWAAGGQWRNAAIDSVFQQRYDRRKSGRAANRRLHLQQRRARQNSAARRKHIARAIRTRGRQQVRCACPLHRLQRLLPRLFSTYLCRCYLSLLPAARCALALMREMKRIGIGHNRRHELSRARAYYAPAAHGMEGRYGIAAKTKTGMLNSMAYKRQRVAGGGAGTGRAAPRRSMMAIVLSQTSWRGQAPVSTARLTSHAFHCALSHLTPSAWGRMVPRHLLRAALPRGARRASRALGETQHAALPQHNALQATKGQQTTARRLSTPSHYLGRRRDALTRCGTR